MFPTSFIKNNKGAKTLPWGTPHDTQVVLIDEFITATQVDCFLLVKQFPTN